MNLSVLMFGWEFPPYNSGGLGTACEGLTRALSDKEVKTIFVLPKKVGVNADFVDFRFANLQNVKFEAVPGLLYPYVTAEGYLKALAESGGNDIYGLSLLEEVRLYALRAKAIAKREKFDVIHAHDWLTYPAGMMAQEVSDKPMVAHVHATEFDRGGGNGINSDVYKIEKEGMERADKIAAVSQWTKNIVTYQYGIPANKVHVVHNGIDVAYKPRFPDRLAKLKADGNKIILFVGRITLQKGPDYFVKVAKRVLEYSPKTYFVMVGSGDMEGQVMQTAAYLGISDRFIFPGFLRGRELDQMYQSADLYILPSVSEPFGITPLESIANGTPVLVSKQSGVSEVLSHALKADFWDIDEMTNQILAVLNHPTLQETLSQYGQLEVGRITWSEAANKCLTLYQQILRA
jgi:glycosyltransferase involved in cell wall biosynthesis